MIIFKVQEVVRMLASSPDFGGKTETQIMSLASTYYDGLASDLTDKSKVR